MFDINKIKESVQNQVGSLPPMTEKIKLSYFNTGDYFFKIVPINNQLSFTLYSYSLFGAKKVCINKDEELEQLLQHIPEMTVSSECYVPCILFNIVSQYATFQGIPEVQLVSSNNPGFPVAFNNLINLILNNNLDLFVKSVEIDSNVVLQANIQKYSELPITSLVINTQNQNQYFTDGKLNQVIVESINKLLPDLEKEINGLVLDTLTPLLENSVKPKLKELGKI